MGNYLYPAAGAALPHAVASITGGTVSTTFTYDLDGNQTAGLGRSITYTSYNKPASITQGSGTLFFSHDPNHDRFKQSAPEGITLYFDVFGIHAELFEAATSQWNEYLMVGGNLVGVRFERSDETVSTRYFTADHLGSIAVITDENANAVERLSYDAWGKRRFSNGADDVADSITSQTSRGFTGQEELADVGLVHLNGRIYDPLVGRMTSADPFVPDPMNGQAWNRYSYVINNPLSITDPNGYCFLGLCSVFNAIEHFVSSVFHAVQSLLRSSPIVGSILQIAAAGICALLPGCQVAYVAVAASAVVAGITSGNLGSALKAGLISAATAIAFNAVGDFTGHNPDFGTPQYFENVAGHALVGCASSVASGGQCGPGALSAGVTSAAGPLINDGNHFNVASLAANSVLGGVASVAGGGKFANGAITGAFGYLFNAAVPKKYQSCGGDLGCIHNIDNAIEPSDGIFYLFGGEVAGAARGLFFAGRALFAETSIFWSGEGTRLAASAWAAENGGLFVNVGAGATPAEIIAASEDAAANANGVAHVFQSANEISLGATWKFEYKALLSNPNVPGIMYHMVDPRTSMILYQFYVPK